MSGLIAAVVAIVMSLIVSGYFHRKNERELGAEADRGRQAVSRQEFAELTERIKVLERIATDGNSLDARQSRQIAADIEALRDRQDG